MFSATSEALATDISPWVSNLTPTQPNSSCTPTQTGHINIMHHFICEHVKDNTFNVIHIPGDQNQADGFTKLLSKDWHKKMLDGLGLISYWGGVLDSTILILIPTILSLDTHFFPLYLHYLIQRFKLRPLITWHTLVNLSLSPLNIWTEGKFIYISAILPILSSHYYRILTVSVLDLTGSTPHDLYQTRLRTSSGYMTDNTLESSLYAFLAHTLPTVHDCDMAKKTLQLGSNYLHVQLVIFAINQHCTPPYWIFNNYYSLPLLTTYGWAAHLEFPSIKALRHSFNKVIKHEPS